MSRDDGQRVTVLHGHGSNVKVVVALADGHCLSCSADETIRKWNLRTGAEVFCCHHQGPVNHVVQCHGLILSASADNKLGVWDARSGLLRGMLDGHTAPINHVAPLYTPGTVSASADHTLRVWNLADNTCRHALIGHDDCVNCVAMTIDGHAISGAADGWLILWDVIEGKRIEVFKGHDGPVNCLLSLGPLAFSGGADGTIRMWEMRAGGTCVEALQAHRAPVKRLAMTQDRRRVISCSDDGTVAVCDVQSRCLLKVLPAHDDGVRDIAVDAMNRVLSASLDGTIRYWNLDTYDCMATFSDHGAGVNCVAFTPDGRVAISGSDDATLRIWELPTIQCCDDEQRPTLASAVQSQHAVNHLATPATPVMADTRVEAKPVMVSSTQETTGRTTSGTELSADDQVLLRTVIEWLAEQPEVRNYHVVVDGDTLRLVFQVTAQRSNAQVEMKLVRAAYIGGLLVSIQLADIIRSDGSKAAVKIHTVCLSRRIFSLLKWAEPSPDSFRRMLQRALRDPRSIYAQLLPAGSS